MSKRHCHRGNELVPETNAKLCLWVNFRFLQHERVNPCPQVSAPPCSSFNPFLLQQCKAANESRWDVIVTEPRHSIFMNRALEAHAALWLISVFKLDPLHLEEKGIKKKRTSSNWTRSWDRVYHWGAAPRLLTVCSESSHFLVLGCSTTQTLATEPCCDTLCTMYAQHISHTSPSRTAEKIHCSTIPPSYLMNFVKEHPSHTHLTKQYMWDRSLHTIYLHLASGRSCVWGVIMRVCGCRLCLWWMVFLLIFSLTVHSRAAAHV